MALKLKIASLLQTSMWYVIGKFTYHYEFHRSISTSMVLLLLSTSSDVIDCSSLIGSLQLRNDSMSHNDCYESISQSPTIRVCAGTIIVYIALSSLRELIQIYQQRLHYILEIVNLISWILYISTLIMVAPVCKTDGAITNVHYSAASISVFLSWFRLLLFLQRFDQVSQKLIDVSFPKN